MSNHPHSWSIAGAPPTDATVVLVDRERLYRWFVAESLRGCGVAVVPCESVSAAVDVLRGRVAPDLLMVDGEMLEGQSEETLRALRAHAGATPCLVLDSDAVAGPSRLGATTTVAKPDAIDTVVALVTSQLHQGVTA